MYSDNPRGTVILLGGCPQKQDDGLIQYLHTGLVGKGWNSALIALGDTPLEQHKALIQANYKEALANTNAAVILLGYACHNKTVLQYASQQNQPLFTAYITLDMNLNDAQYARTLNAPLLDVQGTAHRTDLSSPKTWLDTLRLAKGKRMELPTATRNFKTQEDTLLFLVSQWLKSL